MFRRISAALFAVLACTWLTPLQAAERPKLVVAILVDQLRYDYLERFHDQFGEGGFKLLTDRGTFMTFARYDYCPTITAPGHASFLSGSTPAVHGIIGNDWFDKASGQSIYCCKDASVKGVGTDTPAGQMSPRNFIGATFADQLRLHYRAKVVGISIKDRGAIFPSGKKPAGAYWFEPASGNFVTSTYYRTELPEWVTQFNARKRPQEFIGQKWDRLLKPEAYPGADEAVGEGLLPGEKTPTFPHTITATAKGAYDNIISSPFGNQLLAEFAQAAIEGEQLGQGPQPDLLTVSFSSVDYVGHRFGPYSHEVQDMVLRLDRQLAELFAYLDQKIGLANVTMALTADHGVAPTPEYAAEQGLGGERTDEMTLILDLLAKLNERFGEGTYLLQRRLFNGHLYLNHEALRKQDVEAEAIAKFVREWALATGKFHAAYTRDELLSGRAAGPFGRWVVNGYNAERGGDVVLLYKPFIMNWPGKSGTTHGSPFTYDTHVPVLFYGSGFKPGRYPDEFYIADIVPTLSSALHMDNPPGCMGKPCGAILTAP